MDICIYSDFAGWLGAPEPQLRRIADAGFTHIGWGHQYNTDFAYGPHEIADIRRVLRETGLKVLDVHASYGQEKRFWSRCEYERKAGVDLMKNRAQLVCELEASGTLVTHIPYFIYGISPEMREVKEQETVQLMRSLDELVPYLDKLGVTLAVENMCDDDFTTLDMVLKNYSQLVLCYDTGHGNFKVLKQLDYIEPRGKHLGALHLNDNDGAADLHWSPFMGTVDWERVVRMVADSAYRGPLSFEIIMKATPFQKEPFSPLPNSSEEDQRAYLKDAYARCERVCRMYEQALSETARQTP